jgi:hypothetical protein
LTATVNAAAATAYAVAIFAVKESFENGIMDSLLCYALRKCCL